MVLLQKQCKLLQFGSKNLRFKFKVNVAYYPIVEMIWIKTDS
jgi:hypothetical protein